MSNHYQVELEQQPIELYKLLKIADLVSGGGEAKVVISEGYVLLNGDVEYQKRKKIYHGDIIEFNGDMVELICHNEVTLPTDKKTKNALPESSHSSPPSLGTTTNNPKPRMATNQHKSPKKNQPNQQSNSQHNPQGKAQKKTQDRPAASPKTGQRRAIKFNS